MLGPTEEHDAATTRRDMLRDELRVDVSLSVRRIDFVGSADGPPKNEKSPECKSD